MLNLVVLTLVIQKPLINNEWNGNICTTLFPLTVVYVHLQNRGCHKHEWDQQQVPCRLHHCLHTEETWQWDRPLHRKGQIKLILMVKLHTVYPHTLTPWQFTFLMLAKISTVHLWSSKPWMAVRGILVLPLSISSVCRKTKTALLL